MGLSAARGGRADAQRNYDRLLEVAHSAIVEQGTEASLRDIARRAGVGLGTLYRHFPSREALLDALLRDRLDRFVEQSRAAAQDVEPGAALTTCLHDYLSGLAVYRGVASSLMATMQDPRSPLHASCVRVRDTLEQLLRNAQSSGQVRADIGITDLFALINAVAWILGQGQNLAARQQQLLSVIIDGLRSTGMHTHTSTCIQSGDDYLCPG